MPELSPWPLKNQLTDVLLKDNRINPNAENNCGPTSVAMVLSISPAWTFRLTSSRRCSTGWTSRATRS